MLNRELLERCSNAAGVSGFEDEVRAIIREELQDCCDITETVAGNIICQKKGSGDGPVVALLAHMDEIGFMVQGITPDGFLYRRAGFEKQAVDK